MKRLSTAILIVATGLGLGSLTFNARAAEESSGSSSKSIDPCGKPSSHKGWQTRLYIWWEDGTWHLRSTTAKGDPMHVYNGMVRVRGGEFTETGADANVERKGRHADKGKVATVKNEFAIKLSTGGGHSDSIHFRVSPKSELLVFSLKIDKGDQPDLIAIGAKEVSPASGIFTLPANPDKPRSKDEKDK